MTRRILHPTDFSKASTPAFARALAEARQTRSDLIVVHVLAPVIPAVGASEGYLSPSVYEQMSKSGRAWAQKQMDRLLAKAKAARVRARGMLLEGVAHEQIVRAAKRQRAGLIVMGAYGHSRLREFVFGGATRHVLDDMTRPVFMSH